jgi:hypothetical protein
MKNLFLISFLFLAASCKKEIVYKDLVPLFISVTPSQGVFERGDTLELTIWLPFANKSLVDGRNVRLNDCKVLSFGMAGVIALDSLNTLLEVIKPRQHFLHYVDTSYIFGIPHYVDQFKGMVLERNDTSYILKTKYICKNSGGLFFGFSWGRIRVPSESIEYDLIPTHISPVRNVFVKTIYHTSPESAYPDDYFFQIK